MASQLEDEFGELGTHQGCPVEMVVDGRFLILTGSLS